MAASSIIQQQQQECTYGVVSDNRKFGHEGVLTPGVTRPGLGRIFQRKIGGKGETCQDDVAGGIDGQSVGAVIECSAKVGGVAQGGAAWGDLHEDGVPAPLERREQSVWGVRKLLGRLHRLAGRHVLHARGIGLPAYIDRSSRIDAHAGAEAAPPVGLTILRLPRRWSRRGMLGQSRQD